MLRHHGVLPDLLAAAPDKGETVPRLQRADILHDGFVPRFAEHANQEVAVSKLVVQVYDPGHRLGQHAFQRGDPHRGR